MDSVHEAGGIIYAQVSPALDYFHVYTKRVYQFWHGILMPLIYTQIESMLTYLSGGRALHPDAPLQKLSGLVSSAA